MAGCKHAYGKMETRPSCLSFYTFRDVNNLKFLSLLVFLTKSKNCKIYSIKQNHWVADSQFPAISLLRRRETEMAQHRCKDINVPGLTRESTQHSSTYTSLALCTSSLFGFLNTCWAGWIWGLLTAAVPGASCVTVPTVTQPSPAASPVTLICLEYTYWCYNLNKSIAVWSLTICPGTVIISYSQAFSYTIFVVTFLH